MKEKKIELNAGQKDALERIVEFLQDKDSKVFILKGYAGTGKTTIIKSIIDWMVANDIDFELLASTGRAAKILGDVTGYHANTIHSEIYSFRGFSDNAKHPNGNDDLMYVEGMQLLIQFGLKDEHSFTDVYIIDESSMIADSEKQLPSQSKFGEGRLLSDLFHYDKKAKFIFVGE